MTWHIITRRGKDDLFEPALGNDEPRLRIAIDSAGVPGRMREHVLGAIQSVLGGLPSVIHCDLLSIAMAVYSADVRVRRSATTDGWTRRFLLYVPVSDPGIWKAATPVLQETLAFLSGDVWEFQFRDCDTPSGGVRKQPASFDTACLFSGGLDSLAGAIDLLHQGRKVLLVGHYGGGTTSKFQQNVYDELRKAYGEAALAMRFQVLPPALGRAESDANGEDTQRTRSFLFFALGLAVAGSVDWTVPLFIPENGLISLNVPMTGARSGSASTRTTHPYYVRGMRELLAKIGLKHDLMLPYRFHTKAEMLRNSANSTLLRKLTPLSISCAHPDQRRREGLRPGGHCGHCFPCLIRRAAVATAGFEDALYDTDVLKSAPGPTSKKGRDYRAVRMSIERLKTLPSHRLLFEVLKSGPLEPADVRNFVEVYERGMRELAAFYP